MPSSHLILCRPLLLLPPIPPSIRVFFNESTLRMRWPKYWRFSFSIIPSKEIPGLISFRMDWLELLAVQGTLKSLLQHHSSKASILRRSAFFTVQLSHPYMTTGKTTILTRRTFIGKVMSLLLNNFWQIHGVLYSAPQCHIYQFHYSKFPWAATLQSVSPSLLPESLETADVFCDLIVLLFPEWHIHEIVPHALFYVWLLSLNEMQWRLIHVVWIFSLMMWTMVCRLTWCLPGFSNVKLLVFPFYISFVRSKSPTSTPTQ